MFPFFASQPCAQAQIYLYADENKGGSSKAVCTWRNLPAASADSEGTVGRMTFDTSTIWQAIMALLALLSFGIVGQVIGDGDPGDGGDPDDAGDPGDPGGMPDPAPGAWRGEAPPAGQPAGTPPTPAPAPGARPAPGAAAAPPVDDATRRFQDLERRNAELERQHNELGASHRQLQRMLANAAGLAGPSEPKTPEDARRERLLNQFFDLFPKDKQPILRKLLLENPEKLASFSDAAPEFENQNSRHWQGVARSTTAKLYDSIAEHLIGAGKKGTDLDEETRAELRENFGRWIERDRTGARQDRYEMQDPALVSEFATLFKTRYIDPGRRAAATTVINRGSRTATLPVGGGGNQPVRTPAPPTPDPNDDDAVHKAGWAVAQALKNGG